MQIGLNGHALFSNANKFYVGTVFGPMILITFIATVMGCSFKYFMKNGLSLFIAIIIGAVGILVFILEAVTSNDFMSNKDQYAYLASFFYPMIVFGPVAALTLAGAFTYINLANIKV
jgi:Kef-type K+ transport system membrane component KefB